MMGIARFGVISKFSHQESLWRHGVVHDPAKKKVKVMFCLVHLEEIASIVLCAPSRNCVPSAISPGVWRCSANWQLPIKQRPASWLRSCAAPL